MQMLSTLRIRTAFRPLMPDNLLCVFIFSAVLSICHGYVCPSSGRGDIHPYSGQRVLAA